MTHDDAATSDLLQRARNGDADARGELLIAHRAMLCDFVRARQSRQFRQRCDASDIVQDALLVASRRLDDFLEREPMPLQVWLIKTTRERLIEAQRRHMHAGRRAVGQEINMAEESSDALAEMLLCGDPSPSSVCARSEQLTRLRAAIADLSETDQQVLLMRHLEGRPHAEISQILGLDVATVRQRYARAAARLGKAMADDNSQGRCDA